MRRVPKYQFSHERKGSHRQGQTTRPILRRTLPPLRLPPSRRLRLRPALGGKHQTKGRLLLHPLAHPQAHLPADHGPANDAAGRAAARRHSQNRAFSGVGRRVHKSNRQRPGCPYRQKGRGDLRGGSNGGRGVRRGERGQGQDHALRGKGRIARFGRGVRGGGDWERCPPWGDGRGRTEDYTVGNVAGAFGSDHRVAQGCDSALERSAFAQEHSDI
mmetsp:Transcript_40548/g.73071  ORF Transcript_40548/g.73071 Transcript_40548/m.73071 type:complete len:216 (-) Transcript_40548:1584-2231(-)